MGGFTGWDAGKASDSTGRNRTADRRRRARDGGFVRKFCGGARAATITVPGTSDPWLAGQPDGTTASLNDSAPGQSPVFAGSFLPGTELCWTAEGFVLNMPGTGGFNPDGGSTLFLLGLTAIALPSLRLGFRPGRSV